MTDPVINNLPGKLDETTDKLVGPLLKVARENKKMTLEEVAERLHLDIEIIKSLESDNYAALPGSAYIKGYLRSYANLLGIPPAELSFTGRKLTGESRLLPENINYSNETTAKKLSYFWISAILLFILIVFSSLIQIDNTDTEQKENSHAQSVTADENIKSISIASAERYVKSENSVEAQKVTPGETGTFKVESKADTFIGLVLDYKTSSWTEIYDLHGEKLVYGMIQQGEKIQIDGLQPYSVLLGNADAVEITFEGEKFSLTKYTRNGMAQFVIGSTFNNK